MPDDKRAAQTRRSLWWGRAAVISFSALAPILAALVFLSLHIVKPTGSLAMVVVVCSSVWGQLAIDFTRPWTRKQSALR